MPNNNNIPNNRITIENQDLGDAFDTQSYSTSLVSPKPSPSCWVGWKVGPCNDNGVHGLGIGLELDKNMIL